MSRYRLAAPARQDLAEIWEFIAEPLAGRLCASGAGALLHYERQHGQSRVTGE
jgi:plasmid stabilization system protein ParE